MRLVVGTLAGLLLLPCASFAQTAPARSDSPRMFIDVNLVSSGRSDAKVRTFSGLFLKGGELGRFDVTYPKPTARPVPIDVTAGYFLVPEFAVALGVNRTAHDDSAALSARIPHPTFFAAVATAEGPSEDLRRVETAVHLAAIFRPVHLRRVEWRLSGGPAIFRYSADMVHTILYSQEAPDGTLQNLITISGVTTEAVRGTSVGFHVGTDVGVALMKRLSIAVAWRYTSAIVTVAREPLSNVSQDVRVGRNSFLFGIRMHPFGVR